MFKYIKNKLVIFFRFIFGLDWETVSKKSKPVYIKGKLIGFEFHVVEKHKITNKIRYRWVPAVP